ETRRRPRVVAGAIELMARGSGARHSERGEESRPSRGPPALGGGRNSRDSSVAFGSFGMTRWLRRQLLLALLEQGDDLLLDLGLAGHERAVAVVGVGASAGRRVERHLRQVVGERDAVGRLAGAPQVAAEVLPLDDHRDLPVLEEAAVADLGARALADVRVDVVL